MRLYELADTQKRSRCPPGLIKYPLCHCTCWLVNSVYCLARITDGPPSTDKSSWCFIITMKRRLTSPMKYQSYPSSDSLLNQGSLNFHSHWWIRLEVLHCHHWLFWALLSLMNAQATRKLLFSHLIVSARDNFRQTDFKPLLWGIFLKYKYCKGLIGSHTRW